MSYESRGKRGLGKGNDKSTGQENRGYANLRAKLKQSRPIQIRLASCLWLVHPAESFKPYSLNCAQLAGWKSIEKYPEIATHQGASVKNTDRKWAGRGSVTAQSPQQVCLKGFRSYFPDGPLSCRKWLGFLLMQELYSRRAVSRSQCRTWNHAFQRHSLKILQWLSKVKEFFKNNLAFCLSGFLSIESTQGQGHNLYFCTLLLWMVSKRQS